MAVGGFASRRFGDGTLTTARISFPPGASAVPGFLDEHYRAWRAGLAGLSPDGWTAPLGPSWGPYAKANTVDLAIRTRWSTTVPRSACSGTCSRTAPHWAAALVARGR